MVCGECVILVEEIGSFEVSERAGRFTEELVEQSNEDWESVWGERTTTLTDRSLLSKGKERIFVWAGVVLCCSTLPE